MAPTSKSPTADQSGRAGNVVFFPSRKVTSAKIGTPVASSKGHLLEALESQTAYRRLVDAAHHYVNEPCEETYAAFEEAKYRVRSLMEIGGGDAA